MTPGPAKTDAAAIQLEGNPRLGILAMIVASLFFSFQDGVTKTLIVDYSIWQLVSIRFSVLLLTVFAASFVTGGPLAIVRSAHAWFQVFRGIMLVSEIVLIGLSFRYLGLAEAMTIFHLFPLIGVVMAVLVLKEHLNVTTLASLLLGFVGLFVAVAPGTGLNFIGVCCALGAAFCYATYIVMTRYAAAGDSPMISIFYVSIVGIIIPVLFFADTFTPIAKEHIWLFVMLCGFSVVAQSSVIMALSHASASLLQPLNYLQIVWAAVIGMVVFSDFPAANTIAGGGLIAFAGLLQIVLTRQKAR